MGVHPKIGRLPIYGGELTGMVGSRNLFLKTFFLGISIHTIDS